MGEKIEKRVQYIELKSQSLERSIKSLIDFLEENPTDALNAECRLKHIQGLFAGYTQNHEELLAFKSDSPRVAAFAKIESDYYAVSAQVHKLKAPAPVATSTLLNATNVTFTEKHDLPKLPIVQIPKFDGRHENWTAWKNSFQALVHNRAEITAYVKHSQLNNAVQGLAAQVIEEFEPSDANYPLAWEALCNAYDQKRIIVNEHIAKLLTLPKVTEARSDLLAGLMYTVRQNVKLLQMLEVIIPEVVIVYVLERSLPNSVKSRWVDRLSSDKLPRLQEMYEFIQNTIFKLRQMDDPSQSGRVNKKRAGEKGTLPPSKTQKTTARTLVTTSSASSNACVKCNQSHRLYLCPEFNNLKMKDKWDFIKANKLCRNCLYVHSFPCSSTKRCKKCQKDHHTLLHNDKNFKGPRTENSQPAKDCNQSGAPPS